MIVPRTYACLVLVGMQSRCCLPFFLFIFGELSHRGLFFGTGSHVCDLILF